MCGTCACGQPGAAASAPSPSATSPAASPVDASPPAASPSVANSPAASPPAASLAADTPAAANPEGRVRLLPLEQRLLRHNEELAAVNRQRFQAAGVRVVNLLSSPGSGKTALLERLARDGRPDARRPARRGSSG